MPCYCDLLPTVERLHGKVTPELALRLKIAESANKDDVAFEDHMLLEEKYIIPYIRSEADKKQLLLENGKSDYLVASKNEESP